MIQPERTKSHPTWSELEKLRYAWHSALHRELAGAVELRHRLHMNPEISGAERGTAEAVVAAIGLGPGTEVAGTGRMLRAGPDGPSIALRAELDALPVVEVTGAPYAATNGAMHACGHDVHLAALTAVLRAARDLTLPLGLVAVLQPREETVPTGARDVVNSGLLLGEHVRAVIGAHVQPQVIPGVACADPGPVNAAADEFDIVVRGASGHAAYPHLTRDPVPPLCEAVLALQNVLRTAIDPLHPAVISVGELSGSGAPNVTAEVARASGTLRTTHTADRDRLVERMGAAVRAIAEAHGCSGELVVRTGEPALVNDEELAVYAREWLNASDVPTGSFSSCGADDFAWYAAEVPILMIFVGARTPGPFDREPVLHDSRYLPPDETIELVAKALIAGYLAAALRTGLHAS